MARTIKVKFIFYKVETHGFSFENILSEICQNYNQEINIGGKDCRLLSKEPFSYVSCKALLFTHVRKLDLPPKISGSGEVEELALADDEGLGEHVVIAYHPEIKILAVQKNVYSLSMANVLQYIKSFYPELSFSVTPVLSKDAVERFARCSILRKVKIKISSPSDLSVLQGLDLSVNEHMFITETLKNDPCLEISTSMGRNKGSLSEKWRNMINKLNIFAKTPEGAEWVETLQVSGKEDEDAKLENIDLLAETKCEEKNIELEKRSINVTHLQRNACAVLMENYNELKAYL